MEVVLVQWAVVDLDEVVAAAAEERLHLEVLRLQRFRVGKFLVNVCLRLEDLTRLVWVQEFRAVRELLAAILIKVLVHEALSKLGTRRKDEDENEDVEPPCTH